MFRRISHEDPHEHLRDFVDISGSFIYKKISLKSIGLRVLPIFLIEEATRWLGELTNDYITLWEKLIEAFLVRFFPPFKMVKLRDKNKNFKSMEREPLHEIWLQF